MEFTENSRPLKKCFTSNAVESFILEARNKISDEEIYRIFSQTFPNTLDTTIKYASVKGVPDTYVITGDIDAMWLRDSSAQVWPYLAFMKQDDNLKNLVAGVIKRQAKYILLDPYANAFNYANEGSIWQDDFTEMRPELHERKWEIDSLCYHVRLVYEYWQTTADSGIFDDAWLTTARLIYTTLANQQLKDGRYHYTFQRNTPVATDTLGNNGLGNPVKPIGLLASSFRPSDDATILPFLIPSNFFAANILRKMAQLVEIHYTASQLVQDCVNLADEIKAALEQYAVVEHKKYGKIFAYEVDGFGSQILMDDANVPSLLSLPYLGCIDINDTIYQNTRRFILSSDNPWYFQGCDLTGVGSIHTGLNRVWPLAIIMQGLTSGSSTEIHECLRMLLNTHASTYFMHESINKDDFTDYTRPWFAWANSLFAELVIRHFHLLSS